MKKWETIPKETIDNIINRSKRVKTYFIARTFDYGGEKDYLALIYTKNKEYFFKKDTLTYKGYTCLGVETKNGKM